MEVPVSTKKVTVKRSAKTSIPAIQTLVSLPKTKEEWFQRKLKEPTKYILSPLGDLAVSTEPGATTIELIPQVPSSIEFIQSHLNERNEKRKQAEEAYTLAKRKLYALMKEYKGGSATIAQIVTVNGEVHSAEYDLNKITKDPRAIDFLEEVKGKELNSDTPYDESKIPEPVYACEYGTYPWKFFWMDKPEERIPEIVEEEEQQEGQQGGAKREKTPEEKARIWAIIRAKMAKKKRF